MNNLEVASEELIKADIQVSQAYRALITAMRDRSIPLSERYAMMDKDELSEHFRIVECESIFDEDEVTEINSWE